MTFQSIVYPLDITGTKTSNRVTNSHAITKVGGNQLFAFNFQLGVVFDNLEVTHLETKRLLRNNVDYRLDNIVAPLSRRLNKRVGCTFVLLNKKLSGNISVTAQVLGDVWCNINPKWVNTALNTMSPERVIDYSDIHDVPVEFKVDTHTTNADDITVGMTEVNDTLRLILAQMMKLMPSNTIYIDTIVGLQELLDYKVDYRNKQKVALIADTFTPTTTAQYRRAIVFPMPNQYENRHVVCSITLSTPTNTLQYIVSGGIKKGQSDLTLWDDASVIGIGDNKFSRLLEVRPTYLNGQPMLAVQAKAAAVVGKKYTLQLVNYYTDNDGAENELHQDFVITGFGRDITNMARAHEIMEDDINLPITQIHGNAYKPIVASNAVTLSNMKYGDECRIVTLNYSDSASLSRNGFPWTGSPVDFVKINPLGNNNYAQVIHYRDGRVFRRNTIASLFIEDVLHTEYFDIKRAITLTVPGNSSNYYPVTFYRDMTTASSLSGTLTAKPIDLDLIITNGVDINVKHRGDESSTRVVGLFEGACVVVPENSRTKVDLYCAPNRSLVLGALALTPSQVGRGGVVLYIKGGSVVRGFANVQTTPTTGTSILGVTLPASLATFPASAPANTKLLVAFKEQGRYHSIEKDFLIGTGGVTILLERGNPDLEKGTIYPWAGATPPKGYTFIKGQAIASAHPHLRSLFGAQLPDMRDWAMIGAPDGTPLFSKTLGENKHHTHGGRVHDAGGYSLSTTANGAISNQGGGFAEAYNDFTGPYGSKWLPGNRGGSHGGFDWDNFKVALAEQVGNHTHSVSIRAHGHGLTIDAQGVDRVKPSGIYTNFIVKLS